MTPDHPSRAAMLAAVPRLRAFAISLCLNRDQADDLVEDTLLRASENVASFTHGTNTLAWLCTILRNCFFLEYRWYRRPMEAINGHVESVVSASAQMAHAASRELCAALAKLRPEQREALILTGGSGLSYDEAAKICGCPKETVKSRVNRARSELTKLLSIDGHKQDDFRRRSRWGRSHCAASGHKTAARPQPFLGAVAK